MSLAIMPSKMQCSNAVQLLKALFANTVFSLDMIFPMLTNPVLLAQKYVVFVADDRSVIGIFVNRA